MLRQLLLGVPTLARNGRHPTLVLVALLCAHACWSAWMVAQSRIPEGHDGFQYFSLQHYFLNERLCGGETPLWMPFMSHGTVATWWYTCQAAPLQSILLLTGFVPRGCDFLSIYHVGLFVDELFLLVGLWRLSRVHVESTLARSFVVVVASGMLVSMSQPWFNLHMYYFIPLILSLVHDAIDGNRLSRLAAAVVLTFVQGLGALPYFFPMSTFAIALYLVFRLAAVPAEFRTLVRLVANWRGAAILATATLSTLIPIYLLLQQGTDQIANFNAHRDARGAVTLTTFLEYGGQVHAGKWVETILGVTPHLDCGLYFGVACVPLALVGAIVRRRSNAALGATVAALILLSCGLFPAHLAYFWPMMHYYRHVGLIGPLIRPFLVVLAACGFEEVLLGTPRRTVPLAFVSLASACIAVWLFHSASDTACAPRLLAMLVDNPNWNTVESNFKRPEPFVERMGETSVAAGIACLVLGLAAAFNRESVRRQAAFLLLFVVAGDLALYKLAHLRASSIPLTPNLRRTLEFAPLTYRGRRLHATDGNAGHCEMIAVGRKTYASAVTAEVPRSALVDLHNEHGAQYWSVQSFLGYDESGSSYRIDHWLRPLDRYMNTYWGQVDILPPGLCSNEGLLFPSHPGALAISGCTRERIQLFADVMYADDDQALQRMAAPDYRGDALFLRPADFRGPRGPERDSSPYTTTDAAASSDFVVRRYSANRVVIEVANRHGHPLCLLYSDVWHPWWSVTVDSDPQPLLVANVAYKAVFVPPGTHVVEFACRSTPTAVLRAWFSLASLASLAVLVLSIRR